jgi:hypothetical protein
VREYDAFTTDFTTALLRIYRGEGAESLRFPERRLLCVTIFTLCTRKASKLSTTEATAPESVRGLRAQCSRARARAGANSSSKIIRKNNSSSKKQ